MLPFDELSKRIVARRQAQHAMAMKRYDLARRHLAKRLGRRLKFMEKEELFYLIMKDKFRGRMSSFNLLSFVPEGMWIDNARLMADVPASPEIDDDLDNDHDDRDEDVITARDMDNHGNINPLALPHYKSREVFAAHFRRACRYLGK